MYAPWHRHVGQLESLWQQLAARNCALGSLQEGGSGCRGGCMTKRPRSLHMRENGCAGTGAAGCCWLRLLLLLFARGCRARRRPVKPRWSQMSICFLRHVVTVTNIPQTSAATSTIPAPLCRCVVVPKSAPWPCEATQQASDIRHSRSRTCLSLT